MRKESQYDGVRKMPAQELNKGDKSQREEGENGKCRHMYLQPE